MKRFLLLPLLILLTTCSECYAGYTIIIREQVTPKTIMVQGVGKLEAALNPGPVPVYPATAKRLVYRPADFDIYNPDTAKRAELWEDDNGTATSSQIFATFPQIRQKKEAEIRAEGSRRLLALAQPYSAEERESWPQQKEEAVEFHDTYQPETQSSPCPCEMIRNMATARGIPVSVMADKILENAALFKAAAGQILGIQQGLIDSIATITDFETLENLTW